MTKSEIKQIEEILNFLKDKGFVNSFEIKGETIVITTTDTDKKDIEFLKFRIMSAISIINESLDDTIIIEVVD